MGGEYGYMPRVARSNTTSENVPDTGSLFWFSIPLREAISSLDAAIGTALGLDDDDQRQVVSAEVVGHSSAEPDPRRAQRGAAPAVAAASARRPSDAGADLRDRG